MSNIELIQNALTSLPSITKQEGKEYFEQNHVNDLNYYPNAHMLSANVNGYRVKIDLKNRKVNHCSCYFKTECKHVAATLYAASDPHQSQPVKKSPKILLLLLNLG